MKAILKYLLLSLIFAGCSSDKQEESVVLNGEITNAEQSILILKNNFWEPIDTLQIVDNKFIDTLKIPESYYYLSDGKREIRLYLKPGMNLNFNSNFENPINSTVWKGNGENENNYLISKARLTDNIPVEKRAYSMYGLLEEKEFLLQTDSIYQQYLRHFEAHKDLNEHFAFLEENSIKIEKSIRLSQFEGIKRMLKKKTNF